MNQFEVVAKPRDTVGKGANRRLRRNGKLPAIVYGAGEEVVNIVLDQNDMKHHLEHEAFYSHILTLKIGDKQEKVVLKDLQRHPYKALLLHADLQRISEQENINMRVPLHFLNQDNCVGVKIEGGVINHIMTDVEVVCLPKHLPEYIEIDMLELNIGDAITLSQVKLPDGVNLYQLMHGDPKQPVAAVNAPRAVVEEETEVIEEETPAEVPTTKDIEKDKDDK